MAWNYDTKTVSGLSETNLLIGGGFKLVIGDTYFLVITPSSGSSFSYQTSNTTTWTEVNKS